jgi:hypothetical protein
MMKRRMTTRIATIFLLYPMAMGLPAPASGSSLLPIKAGEYYFDSRDSCGGPSTLSWNGRGFLADYVYMDHVTSVKKTAPNVYQLVSVTKTSDENTRLNGRTWLADVRVLDEVRFTFAQYAKKTPASAEAPRTYRLCRARPSQ